jgi:anaerobic selenocysteine-containing dehydrogenase
MHAADHPSLSRRDFLRGMTAAGLATVAGGAPRLSAAEAVKHPAPTADTCILL